MMVINLVQVISRLKAFKVQLKKRIKKEAMLKLEMEGIEMMMKKNNQAQAMQLFCLLLVLQYMEPFTEKKLGRIYTMLYLIMEVLHKPPNMARKQRLNLLARGYRKLFQRIKPKLEQSQLF